MPGRSELRTLWFRAFGFGVSRWDGDSDARGATHRHRYVLALKVAFENFFVAPLQEQHSPVRLAVVTLRQAAAHDPVLLVLEASSP